MKKAISVNNITKKYKLYKDNKERLLDFVSPKDYGEDFYALKDVSFEAIAGKVVGFVGINGSGKSTLSNIIAGIVPETSGSVQVNGETALIAVSAGLKNDLTGRDNIELKCLMIGLSKEEIERLEPDIIAFSELGEFIDQPVKSYSSGMKSRLGFSISVNIDPDILIIDEALSVGDKAFSEKSLRKMNEFKDQGKTMIFVSHSLGQMREFCQKILWLEFGMVKEYGDVEEVLPRYEEFLTTWQKMSGEEREKYKGLSIHERDLSSFRTNQRQTEKPKEEVYRELPTSLLGHINSAATYIYDSPRDLEEKSIIEGYKHKCYFIKRQVQYNNEIYFLLSKQPSAISGVVGWVKSSEVNIHEHIAIDNDPKCLVLTGKGSGYAQPWGGKKDIIYTDLKAFKGLDFDVNKTEMVGKNIWYCGSLNGQEIWVHSKFLHKK